jgi:glycosyltransferase involved in cell wall biosynthesis
MKVTVVIPAYNEETGIGLTLDTIPVAALNEAGFEVEKLVVDNASSDRTAEVAMEHGARVVYQPKKGYGNAYQCGFSNATGDIIACGDADLTYPFEALPQILRTMQEQDIEFMNTNRLKHLKKGVMHTSHIFGNHLLSLVMRVLYNTPFKDSQSGMWIFKRNVWQYLSVEHTGMPFSQEIKIEAYIKGFKCGEVPIDYRSRVGEGKLSVVDAYRTMFELFRKRFAMKKELLGLTTEEVE